MGLYERIVNPSLLTRRITLTANHLKDADKVKDEPVYEQLDLFSGDLLYAGQEPAQDTDAAGKRTSGKGKTFAGSNAPGEIQIRKKCHFEGSRLTRGRYHNRQESSDRWSQSIINNHRKRVKNEREI